MISRERKAKLNISVSLLNQIVSMVCGFVVPKLYLRSFGSEIYGATASIAQFLAYITLLDGGIGAVARAALYKPLAENDLHRASMVLAQTRRFFRTIGYIFAVYVIVLACSFKTISQTESLDWISSVLLVIVISISTFAQYFIGISYSILLQAAQQIYITNGISIATTIFNTLLVVVFINQGCSITIVKLVSSCVFVLRPIIMRWYVRKHYAIEDSSKADQNNLLQQKGAALGQHIAYFLHSNTDVVVLTVFADLKAVAVYSVYRMVISKIQNIATSFSSGMEALFGDMLAKDEKAELHRTFDYYVTLISLISVILFATTASLIIPFIRIYTSGIADTNYIEPLFGLLLTLESTIYCFRLPYHAVVMAAGEFKRTQMAAYGEAIINVGLSVILVVKMGLVGVAIGTILATAFRLVYYAIFLSRNILFCNIGKTAKRAAINLTSFLVAYIFGSCVAGVFPNESYLWWAISAVPVGSLVIVIVLATNLALDYRSATKTIAPFLHARLRKK